MTLRTSPTLVGSWMLVPLLSIITAPVPAAHAQSYPPVHYPAGDAPQCVPIGDLDGDRAPDLAVASVLDDSVSVLLNQSSWPCYADCNEDGIVNTLDFICYLNQYNDDDPRADCNGDGIINTVDFLCFLNAYNEGC